MIVWNPVNLVRFSAINRNSLFISCLYAIILFIFAACNNKVDASFVKLSYLCILLCCAKYVLYGFEKHYVLTNKVLR